MIEQLHAPVGVVNLGVVAQKLLLALLVGQVSSDLITVLFGLEEGNEVDASPHLFTAEFAISCQLLFNDAASAGKRTWLRACRRSACTSRSS